MRTVKVGILGSGFAADFHARAYAEIAGAEVVAVSSKTKAHADEFAKRHGVRKVYSGDSAVEKMSRDREVDAIDVNLPNYMHRDAVVLGAENGKHVILEKPMAINVEEAREMLDAVERHHVLHGYAENQIFSPHVERVLEMVRNGSLGDVLWVRSREAHFGPHSAWFWDPKLAGGGVLMDMGCHSVEVARKIIGKNPVDVFCWGATLLHRIEAEDNSLILVRYEGGGIGQSENSWAARGGLDIRFEVHGTEGAAFVDVTRESGIRVFSLAPEEKISYIVEKAEAKRGWMYPTWREHETFGYLSELRHFVECFGRGEMPKENLRDGYEVNAILDAGYRSMRSGKWEKMG